MSRSTSVPISVLLCGTTLGASLAVGLPSAAADYAGREDPFDDTVNETTGLVERYPAADITSYHVVTGIDGVFFGLGLAEPSAPQSDPRWDGTTFVTWDVDIDEDQKTDFVAVADNAGSELYDVRATDEDPLLLCAGSALHKEWNDAKVTTSFPSWCMRGASRVGVSAAVVFDSDPQQPDAPLYTDEGPVRTSAAKLVFPFVDERYHQLDGPWGVMGHPTSELQFGQTSDGRHTARRSFERGVITSVDNIANDVHGPIYEKWKGLGEERGFLGYPRTRHASTADGVGRYNHFDGGSIYWSPRTGAREVHGGIRQKWSTTGWERGPLGYPTTDELRTPDGGGRFNHFQRGSIYWTPATNAQEIRGAIRDKWAATGWERGVLGYPVTDEYWFNFVGSRTSRFQRGAIYWSPGTGAYELHGAIYGEYSRVHHQISSALGLPVTDELRTPDGRGRFNHFERGSIYWNGREAYAVYGGIRQRWASLGWERSRLGYPTFREYDVPGGRYQPFEGGSIFWNATTRSLTVTYR